MCHCVTAAAAVTHCHLHNHDSQYIATMHDALYTLLAIHYVTWMFSIVLSLWPPVIIYTFASSLFKIFNFLTLESQCRFCAFMGGPTISLHGVTVLKYFESSNLWLLLIPILFHSFLMVMPFWKHIWCYCYDHSTSYWQTAAAVIFVCLFFIGQSADK